MYQMCPWCLKNGIKSKIKAYQINLKEAVWLCETTDCIWPFSSEKVEYISRDVGKKWSYNWTTYKPQSNIHTEPLVQDLFLYTPPDTPETDASKDVLPNVTYDSPNSSSNPAVHSDHNYANFNDSLNSEPLVSDISTVIDSDHLIQSNLCEKEIKCEAINSETKRVSTVTSELIEWSEDSKQLENPLGSKLTTQNDVNQTVLMKKSSEKKCTSLKINFKKSIKNGDSKKYEKFSFDKVVTQKTDSETTLPKKVDDISSENSVELNMSCALKQDCNTKTSDDSLALDLESLLNEMSTETDYSNDQNFDTDWFHSLLETA